MSGAVYGINTHSVLLPWFQASPDGGGQVKAAPDPAQLAAFGLPGQDARVIFVIRTVGGRCPWRGLEAAHRRTLASRRESRLRFRPGCVQITRTLPVLWRDAPGPDACRGFVRGTGPERQHPHLPDPSGQASMRSRSRLELPAMMKSLRGATSDHQQLKGLLRHLRVFSRHAAQRAVPRIHGGLGQLPCIHLPQTLIALDRLLVALTRSSSCASSVCSSCSEYV